LHSAPQYVKRAFGAARLGCWNARRSRRIEAVHRRPDAEGSIRVSPLSELGRQMKDLAKPETSEPSDQFATAQAASPRLSLVRACARRNGLQR
jgi:hypothetical protein